MANMTLTKTPMPEQDPQVRARNFKEVALGYTAEQAIEEANRCLGCKNPKCVEGCPVNVRIPEFIKKVQEGDFKAAYEIITSTNALPALSGRVCPRKASAKPSASAASRVKALLSAAWSVSVLTGTAKMSMPCPRRSLPTASAWLLSVPALPV